VIQHTSNSVAAENEFVLEQSQESSNQSDTRAAEDPYTPRVIVHPIFNSRLSQNSIIEGLRQRVSRKERATGVSNATYRPRCDAGAGFVPLGAQAAAPHDL
jgi:hypothetical protein